MNGGQAAVHSLAGLLRDASLVFGASGVISPLWSLRWEVLFSLLLPIYALFFVRGNRFWWLKVVTAVALVMVGASFGKQSLLYLLMFELGALLAVRWDSIEAFAGRLFKRP